MAPLHIARETYEGLRVGWSWGWALSGPFIRARIRTIIWGVVRP